MNTSWDEHDQMVRSTISNMPRRKCMYYFKNGVQCDVRATHAFGVSDVTGLVRLYCDEHYSNMVRIYGLRVGEQEHEVIRRLNSGRYVLCPRADHG